MFCLYGKVYGKKYYGDNVGRIVMSVSIASTETLKLISDVRPMNAPRTFVFEIAARSFLTTNPANSFKPFIRRSHLEIINIHKSILITNLMEEKIFIEKLIHSAKCKPIHLLIIKSLFLLFI